MLGAVWLGQPLSRELQKVHVGIARPSARCHPAGFNQRSVQIVPGLSVGTILRLQRDTKGSVLRVRLARSRGGAE